MSETQEPSLKQLEIYSYCCDESPFTVMLVPSGRPDLFLEVYENPYEHSIELTSVEEFKKRVQKHNQSQGLKTQPQKHKVQLFCAVKKLNKESKRQIYEIRKQAKASIKIVKSSLLSVAEDRKEIIREWINISRRNDRGRFAGLVFDGNSLRVQAYWDFYEGISQIDFPQQLLWSDAELLKIKK